MRKTFMLTAVLLVTAACGGGSGLDLEGGAVFTGQFEPEPGIGPGEVVIELDDSGTRIPFMRIDAGLDGFICPAGEMEGIGISGGGYTVEIDPGIQISGDSFESDGFAGTFTSASEADGTYDLSVDFDCDYVVSWSATTDSGVGS